MIRLRDSLSILIATVLLVPPSRALAQDNLHLAWNDCAAYGLSTRTFACDTNAGFEHLVGSFNVPVSIPQLGAVEADLRVLTSDATLPDWWSLQSSGGCRPTSLSPTGDFSTVASDHCLDPWTGRSVVTSTLFTFAYGGSPNVARIQVVTAVPAGEAFPVDPGPELIAFVLVLNHQKTVGAGACGGCDRPLGLVLLSLQLDQPDGAVYRLDFNYTSIAGWQCPGYFSSADGPGGTCELGANCPVPARRPTWGAVKAQYR